MLVLSRKAGESIVINDSVCVKVLHTKRGSVRLGIEAPENIPVVRDELRRDEPHVALRPCHDVAVEVPRTGGVKTACLPTTCTKTARR